MIFGMHCSCGIQGRTSYYVNIWFDLEKKNTFSYDMFQTGHENAGSNPSSNSNTTRSIGKLLKSLLYFQYNNNIFRIVLHPIVYETIRLVLLSMSICPWIDIVAWQKKNVGKKDLKPNISLLKSDSNRMVTNDKKKAVIVEYG